MHPETPFGWCRQVFLHCPYQHKNILILGKGVRRPSDTIQNLILSHKLIQIHGVFLHTIELITNLRDCSVDDNI